jgi:cytochrome c biogenesis protein CcmG, thiol:disulfide interchange protein DsbE
VERTWAAAFRDVFRSAARHKVATALIAVCVVATLTVITVIGTTSHTATGPNAEGVGAVIPAGEPAAPSFSFPELGHPGERVSLASYAGKPLIVNFFASWCPPCKQETPMLASFYRHEHGSVPLVGLDENDTTGKALSFAKANEVSYPLAWDPGLIGASAYGVSGMPQTFFLNAGHRIVYHVIGQITTAELNQGITLATGAAS